ncbi:hypothetical protein BKA70DRAFT_1401119 [Coprinopsis sp. MPI-PUGE-AT-0042]|nr:hypothetical protein BKA70DRAFT_1401119 [Coprinopsis sp. MPI-PUGE-AT-0042]
MPGDTNEERLRRGLERGSKIRHSDWVSRGTITSYKDEEKQEDLHSTTTTAASIACQPNEPQPCSRACIPETSVTNNQMKKSGSTRRRNRRELGRLGKSGPAVPDWVDLCWRATSIQMSFSRQRQRSRKTKRGGKLGAEKRERKLGRQVALDVLAVRFESLRISSKQQGILEASFPPSATVAAIPPNYSLDNIKGSGSLTGPSPIHPRHSRTFERLLANASAQSKPHLHLPPGFIANQSPFEGLNPSLSFTSAIPADPRFLHGGVWTGLREWHSHSFLLPLQGRGYTDDELSCRAFSLSSREECPGGRSDSLWCLGPLRPVRRRRLDGTKGEGIKGAFSSRCHKATRKLNLPSSESLKELRKWIFHPAALAYSLIEQSMKDGRWVARSSMLSCTSKRRSTTSYRSIVKKLFEQNACTRRCSLASGMFTELGIDLVVSKDRNHPSGRRLRYLTSHNSHMPSIRRLYPSVKEYHADWASAKKGREKASAVTTPTLAIVLNDEPFEPLPT